MERLCERPGCSDPASVAYGMRPEDLVFWLDRLRDPAASDNGVLCRRHADSMVVPRGWTLDDLRDPDLHLFRPPIDDSGPITRRRIRHHTTPAEHEQLALDVATSADDGGREAIEEEPVPAPVAAPAGEPVVESVNGDDDTVTPWMPIFDTDDDLDGLLSARSPLLSRAFRGERPS